MSSHIIIAGTGKSGTTALLKVLTLAGLDTGYTEKQVRAADVERGGLEYVNPKRLWKPGDPEILKTPHWADLLEEAIGRGMKVKACIVPVRELKDAAKSAVARGNAEGRKAWLQEDFMAMRLHKMVRVCSAHGIPIYTLPFPEWTEERFWLEGILNTLFWDKIDPGAFSKAWEEVCGRVPAKPQAKSDG